MTVDAAAPAELPRPELCVGIVAVRDGALLMVKRGRGPGQGYWSLPGGRVEPGETMGEAVVRELDEETALVGVCGELVGWVERIGAGPPPFHYAIFDFEVTLIDDRLPRAGDDAADAAMVPLHEVTELDLVEGLAEFLAEHGVIPDLP
jgi:ADP-ribose pyrophosphatase YjhB (NUDIX family)